MQGKIHYGCKMKEALRETFRRSKYLKSSLLRLPG